MQEFALAIVAVCVLVRVRAAMYVNSALSVVHYVVANGYNKN